MKTGAISSQGGGQGVCYDHCKLECRGMYDCAVYQCLDSWIPIKQSAYLPPIQQIEEALKSGTPVIPGADPFAEIVAPGKYRFQVAVTN